MDRETLESLHTNQRLLLKELLKRGVKLSLLVKELELVEARLGSHVELLLDRDSTACPYPASVLSGNKYVTKKLLQRAGIDTPAGEQFFADQKSDALRFAAVDEGPWVVKPSFGSHGIGCSTDCITKEDLELAIDHALLHAGKEAPFLIEEQHIGMEYRIFITKNDDYAVLNREPAYVIGNGKGTIRALAEEESYVRMNPRTNCLCPIQLDLEVQRFLTLQGLDLDSVIPDKQKIYLRRNSNIALGGVCRDVTALVHTSTIEVAAQALAAFAGLPYAGIDILATDITKAWSKSTHCVLEVNSNPGIHMHMRPAYGPAQNVAAYLADIIFPETMI